MPINVTNIPHPFYGNYGGKGRSRWYLPPKDIYDVAFKWHDAETSKANKYGFFKKALAWNVANQLLGKRLKDKIELRSLAQYEEDKWNEWVRNSKTFTYLKKKDTSGFWDTHGRNPITISRSAFEPDYAKLYVSNASWIFRWVLSPLPAFGKGLLEGAIEEWDERITEHA